MVAMRKKSVHAHSILAYRGGAARVLRLLQKELVRRGWNIRSSCEIDDLPHDATHLEKSRIIAPGELGKNLEDSSICHVHSSLDWPLLCKGLTEKKPSVPVCITMHDCSLLTGGCVNPLDCPGWRRGCIDPCPLKYKNAPEVQAVRRAALIRLNPRLIVPSQWLGSMVRKTLPDLDCKLIPNGVEENNNSAIEARKELGLAPGVKMVLFVAHGGHDAHMKGAKNWLGIWHVVKQAIPGSVAFMVGGSEVKKEGDVVFWPYLDREHMQKVMAAADILLYPSLADNHPLVVLEAMAAGVAICAYNVGGISEQVRQGQNGLLVDVGQQAKLIENCIEILKKPALCREMGRTSRAFYEKIFTVQQMTDKYETIYNNNLRIGV